MTEGLQQGQPVSELESPVHRGAVTAFTSAYASMVCEFKFFANLMEMLL